MVGRRGVRRCGRWLCCCCCCWMWYPIGDTVVMPGIRYAYCLCENLQSSFEEMLGGYCRRVEKVDERGIAEGKKMCFDCVGYNILHRC